MTENNPVSEEKVREQFVESINGGDSWFTEDDIINIEIRGSNVIVSISLKTFIEESEIPQEFEYKTHWNPDNQYDGHIKYMADKEDLSDEYREDPFVLDEVADHLRDEGYDINIVSDRRNNGGRFEWVGYIDIDSDPIDDSNPGIDFNVLNHVSNEYNLRVAGTRVEKDFLRVSFKEISN